MLKKTLSNLLYPVAAIALLFLVYWIAAAAAGESLILPMPKETFAAFFKLLGKRSFYQALFTTLLRALIAFAVSFVGGFMLALAADKFTAFKKFLSPLMTFLRAIPTMAVIFLLVLWFSSSTAPSVVAATVILPACYGGFLNSFSTIDGKVLQMSRAFGVPKKTVLTRFILPALLPQIAENGAGNLSLTVKLVIAGEALAQSFSGLGGMLNIANAYLETATLMALTLAAVAVCFIIEGAVRLLFGRKRKWSN